MVDQKVAPTSIEYTMRFSVVDELFGKVGNVDLIIATLREKGMPVVRDSFGEIRAERGSFHHEDHVRGAQNRTYFWTEGPSQLPSSSSNIYNSHSFSNVDLSWETIREPQSLQTYESIERAELELARARATEAERSEVFRAQAEERDRVRRTYQQSQYPIADDIHHLNYEEEQKKIEIVIKEVKPRAIELEKE